MYYETVRVADERLPDALIVTDSRRSAISPRERQTLRLSSIAFLVFSSMKSLISPRTILMFICLFSRE